MELNYEEADQDRKKRILYVEDDEAIIKITCLLMERLGYEVVKAMRSDEAIRLLESDPYNFDLVITDMGLPDMNGILLAEKVEEIRPDIPIILCTGYGDLVDRQHVRDAGLNDILLKPFSMETIAKAIEKAIQGEKI